MLDRKMKNKKYHILIFLLLIFIINSIPIYAHKVNIFAYIEGNEIYTESYFNDGKKCINSKIEVFNDEAVKLLEGLTDDKGVFVFSIPQANFLKIVLTASAGHRAEYILKLDASEEEFLISELEDSSSEVEAKGLISEEIFNDEIVSYISKEEIQLIINEALDKKLTPIMREIKKSQEDDISFSEIIGGIGYIFGIFGMIAYFLSRKK